MFGKIIDAWKMFRAAKAVQKEPIYLCAIQAGQSYLTDKTQGIGKYAPKEFKQKLAERIGKEVNEIILAPNRLMANREKLVVYTIEMAKYQVLILPSEAEDENDPAGLRGKPGISGELKSNLKSIAEKDKEITEWYLGASETNEIYDACLLQFWTYHLLAHVFQSVRAALNDMHPDPDKDWYRPFVEAMCAWQESLFRKLIGLPDLLPGLEALKYSTFMDIVLSGATYPNFEWEESYRDNNIEEQS